MKFSRTKTAERLNYYAKLARSAGYQNLSKSLREEADLVWYRYQSPSQGVQALFQAFEYNPEMKSLIKS